MWLENLKELKKEKGLSVKQIADLTNLPERTVARIFSGDTDSPYVDTLHRIVTVLGGSLDSILADTKTVLGTTTLATAQTELSLASDELSQLQERIKELEDANRTLAAENERLKLKIKLEEELLRSKEELLRSKEELLLLYRHTD